MCPPENYSSQDGGDRELGGFMKTVVRCTAIGAVLMMVAAACSKPPKLVTANSKTKVTAPSVAPPVSAETASTDTTAPPSTVAATATTARAARTAKPAPTGNVAPPGVDDAQAKAVGAAIQPQTTARHQPYY
ncbi:MAG TPA: hypothetical protein VHN98_00915, partial [Acidimicrobiales bacterium]|nr:hypothetical protein [Acidimicrobiales bacterium]